MPFEFLAIAGNDGEREMRIDADVAVARKMLGGGEGAVFLHAANELGDVFGNALRVFAERAHIDDGIIGIVVHVRVGRENPVHARGARFERDGFADRVGELGIARGGDGHRGGKRRAFVEPHAGAGFEVRAEQQRNFRAALQFVGHDGRGIHLAALDAQRAARRCRRSCRRRDFPRLGAAALCILRFRWR